MNQKNKNKNCDIVCIIKEKGNKANQINPDSIRKKYNFELNIPLSVEQLRLIATDYFTYNLVVVNNIGDELYNSHSGFENTIFLLLKDENYYHIDIKKIKKYKKCPDCNKLYLNDQNCNNDRIEYFHSQIKKDVKFLKIKSNEENEEINYENDILYFDMETFQDGINFVV